MNKFYAKIILSFILDLTVLLVLSTLLYFLFGLGKRTIIYFVTLIVFVIAIVLFSSNDKTKIINVTICVILPYFGFILCAYLALEKLIRKRSKNAKKASEIVYDKALKDLQKENVNLAKVAEYVDYRTNFPILYIQKLEYFSKTSLLLDEIIKEIYSAKSFVYLQFYIVKESEHFFKLYHALEYALKRGVKVEIGVDFFGSKDFLSSKYGEILKNLGVKITQYNPIGLFLGLSKNKRCHQKIVVIDGNVAFLGGVNFNNELIRSSKDSGVKIYGDGAKSCLNMCFRHKNKEKSFNFSTKNQNLGYIQPFSANGNDIIEGLFLRLIDLGKKQIVITTPYLSVSDNIYRALEFAIFRGVEIKIMLPYKVSKLIKIINEENAKKLNGIGVKIYFYKEKFLHQKMIVIDDSIALIGSQNFDLRSSRYQLEDGAIIANNRVIDRLLIDFSEMEKDCVRKNAEFNSKNNIFNQALLRLFAYFI